MTIRISALLPLLLIILIQCKAPQESTTASTKESAIQTKATSKSEKKTVDSPMVYADHDSKSYSIKYPSDWKLYKMSQYAEMIIVKDETVAGTNIDC